MGLHIGYKCKCQQNLEATPKHLYGPAWNYVLVTEMVKSLVERTDRVLLSDGDPDAYAIRQYYESNRSALQMDFGARVTQALTAQLEPSVENLLRTTQEVTQSAINELMDYHIQRHLLAFSKKEKLTFSLVADDLDKRWNPSNQQSIDLLVALIDEADRLRPLFEGQLKVVIFLRQDIFDAMAQRDDDLPKRSYLRMEWTNTNLKHVVAERLANDSATQWATDEEIWAAVFPEEVDAIAAPDYILARALPRPRDVLGLCQAAIDQAKKNGHSWVTAQDIIDGERSNATDFVRALEAEFTTTCPRLGAILNVFSRIGPRITWQEFVTLAELAIEDQEEVLKGWIGPTPRTPRWLATALFEIGFIGLSQTDSNSGSFRNGRSFEETWVSCSPTPLVHIHPAFYANLGI